jgi:hypothetical protein
MGLICNIYGSYVSYLIRMIQAGQERYNKRRYMRS